MKLSNRKSRVYQMKHTFEQFDYLDKIIKGDKHSKVLHLSHIPIEQRYLKSMIHAELLRQKLSSFEISGISDTPVSKNSKEICNSTLKPLSKKMCIQEKSSNFRNDKEKDLEKTKDIHKIILECTNVKYSRRTLTCLSEKQNKNECNLPSEPTQTENLLNFNDSDMQALYEYKENLPSLDSTLEMNQAYDAEFATIKDSSRDIDYGDLAQSLEQKLNSIQSSQYSKMPFEDINNLKSNLSNFCTIEENKTDGVKYVNKQNMGLINYLKPTKISVCRKSQSPKSTCISSVNTSIYGKSFYKDKSKVCKSKLKQPSIKTNKNMLNKSTESRPHIPSISLQFKVKSDINSKLRVPTPTKNCKFILNCKAQEKQLTPRLSKSCIVDSRMVK